MSFSRWVIVCLMATLTAQQAVAKDLTHRLGIGYKNQYSFDLPSLATEYYPSPTTGLSLALGLDTEKDRSKFGCMLRLHKVIFPEDNMNFYMGGGVGVINEEISASTRSGFEVAGFAGAEFFFTGLDSLGITFEAGVGVTSTSDGVRFRTVGDSPLRAGMIFYF